jgi:hypothetical protein
VTAPRLGLWWVAALAVGAGVVIIGLDRVRLGGYVLAGALGLAALLRLLLPTWLSGGLAVRSRAADVTTMTALAAALALATAVLDLRPRG